MSNTLTIEFAGDADKLQRAGRQAQQATDDVASAARDAGQDLEQAGNESQSFTDKLGKLGAGIDGISTAFDDAGAAVQAMADIQQASAERAQKMKRALNDVKQAQEDYNQALRDGKQAAIDSDQAEVDLEQARLDQATAMEAYNEAVKEFGAGSNEAKQAQIDLAQAGVDVRQAQEDAEQATRDASQANIDAEAAQLDLNDAMKEAHPPELQRWADNIQLVMPLLSGLTGVMGLVTAAQWAWNAAQMASPTTWIILAVVALVAIIVVIATKTQWFQKAWRASWGWIKDAARNTWNWLKQLPGWIGNAFANIGRTIAAPFRAAFNFIADAWNNTIGRLSWTVPGWVPWIGGQTISVPNLPKFHRGGTVPGAPGSEMLAVLQAGETVTPAGAGGDTVTVVVKLDSDTLIEGTARAVRRRGGNVQLVLGGRNA